MKVMSEHNKLHDEGKVGWRMGVSEDSDWTEEELNLWHGGVIPDQDSRQAEPLTEETRSIINQRNAPESWNWVEEGGVTDVKNQVKNSFPKNRLLFLV